MSARGSAAVACIMLLSLLTYAANAVSSAPVEALPQPLTLEYALSLVDAGHPSMQQARAMELGAQARERTSEAEDDLSISLEARARWVQPPDFVGDEVLDDHKGSLFIRKPLYDFGRSSARQRAASSEVRASRLRLQSLHDQHRLAIMQAYFDVVMADQENFRDNEAMAVAYITLDRLRTRRGLGQSSDIEVLEQERNYQSIRSQLLASEARQRLERSRLANLLDRPGQLPSDVVRPTMRHMTRPLPGYEPLLQLALQHNPVLRALRLEVEAAQYQVDSASSGRLPHLDAELEASRYSRDLGSSDRWRAGVTLTVPIYNGGRIDAAVASEQAQLLALQAQLSEAEQTLRQTVLDRWYEVQRLQRQRELAQSELAYRELYLDRSRANYEMEVQADLGDAMVRLSEAQLALLKNEFDTELAWEQIFALLGVTEQDVDKLMTASKEGGR